MEFVKEVLVDVNTRLIKLESVVDQDYMKTDDFKNFFHKMLLKAAIDLRKEKMKLFTNIIVNSTLVGKANTQDRWKYLYAETIDKIDHKTTKRVGRIHIVPKIIDQCRSHQAPDRATCSGMDTIAACEVNQKTAAQRSDRIDQCVLS